MRFTHLRLDNWRNFRRVDVALQQRVFVVGPNASGKSNLLDVFRFLRDIAEPEGGFQRAVKGRGGVSHIRCLHARQQPDVVIQVEFELEDGPWSYRLAFAQDNLRRPLVSAERVVHNDVVVLDRPDADDRQDKNRLTQTHLEQVSANKDFRPVTEFFSQVKYLHIIPQLIRESERTGRSNDPYGSDFLEQVARTPAKTLNARLRKINSALRVAVPNLEELTIKRDDRGVPHLQGLHKHWRPKAGWQSEEHFSDGTLRLLGLLWSFLDGAAPLLLEEPELSLHAGVVRHIPGMMAQAGRRTHRQTLISSHSADLLSDAGIGGDEVLLLKPTEDGTQVEAASDDQQIRALLEGGLPVGDAVIPRTAPVGASQLILFDS